ncbi:hypothetical protein I3843_09G178900 [Carya illinoinensis]|nr:hypothetical protein I3843_09G178900 [Carya illinoinensis]
MPCVTPFPTIMTNSHDSAQKHPFKATSLFTTLSTNNLCYNRITNPTSTHALPGLSPNRMHSQTLYNSQTPQVYSQFLTMTNRPHDFSISGSLVAETSMAGEDTTSVLDTMKVLDLNGNAILIYDLWKDRKVVVAFARHFGCLGSSNKIIKVIRIIIGSSIFMQARAFTEQTKFKGEVYADSTHSSYEALQFVSGVSTTFTPKSGIIVVSPGKTSISYIRKDKEIGDDPDIKDILKTCYS